ncbi:formate dehydrogenase accessory protein [Anaeromyxobacter dehalogenans 2CP-1]|uniref:Formate dehydrogenase accessory protein n=1 Tax=Anaeromyxobacter dehalogenans (strain ATCC BAA-258 / DSM 21875 / 2CP-1) TaxID=455488 RepID=B8J722_ANAD2|nr:formate dehydrogenase accessory protein FdhE [Anaeromyxobacter dehalogenans]ACL65212.1 formate dehydrogenase accessory protein [Anaeromyxobacter dehalogenans 2CP-1]
MDTELQDWLRTHPYLSRIADVQGRVEDAAARAEAAPPPAPEQWEAYRAEYGRGVALLRAEQGRPDVAAHGAAALEQVIAALDAAPLPDAVAAGVRELKERFAGRPADLRGAVAWVLDGEHAEAPAQPGLLRYLGWSALRRVLAPTVAAFQAWRDEDGWMHAHCPTCAARPVVAQLVPAAAGRERRLACGCCGTRWKFRRIGCPYCGNATAEKIDVFEVEGEDGLRLDVCQGCNGYLKTVAREGAPDLLLADWTTLQLDALARERGYKRLGTSLYEL